MKTLFFFDIDATLADARWRNIAAGREPNRKHRKKYKQWLKRVQNKKSLMKDKPVKGMKELVKATKKNAFYLTSRSEHFRDVTEKWLRKHNFPELKLFMRGPDDWKSSGTYKESVVLSVIKNKKINIVILDDDPKLDLLEACKRNGWTMLRAMSG